MTLRAELQDWRHRRHDRPMPTVQVEHGTAVRGVWLRIAAACAATGLLLLTAARTDVILELALVGAGSVGGWSLVRPGRVPAHLAVVVSALLLLGSRSAPFDPAVLWLLPAALLTVRLGWWAEHVAGGTLVEVAALRGTVGRDLLIVAVSTVVAAVAWAATAWTAGALLVLGGLALVVLAWWTLPRWTP
ncbi:hypothetical protein [Isoptericola sp. b408]|uniref:hypothetical protein n=1 Tax=Isoptericola sp. b408 TaxID=3064653 RepID=UPI002713E54C|nr:hypothetical protein [Isoptericola sp. b408]MDO8152564.1 hypothetical protein [Isoptericola sp. b408]